MKNKRILLSLGMSFITILICAFKLSKLSGNNFSIEIAEWFLIALIACAVFVLGLIYFEEEEQ